MYSLAPRLARVKKIPDKKMVMDAEEYFKKNGMSEKWLHEISEEHKMLSWRSVTGQMSSEEYFQEYFRTGLDEFIERVDLFLNCQLFNAVLGELDGYQDLFEPCCQSGIFGCFVASGFGGDYIGMDKEIVGITKAKTLAAKNSLNPDIFVVGDVLDYRQEHEALVGRYVVNSTLHSINDDMMDAVSRISKNVLLIQPMQNDEIKQGVGMYRSAFDRHGYSFRVLREPVESDATGACVFLFRANKPGSYA